MASWLKAAEDLLEVVDRRAKLVVGELSDEQSDSQLPASNGRGSQARRTKSGTKAQKRLSAHESPEKNDFAREQTSSQPAQSDVARDKERAAPSVENKGATSTDFVSGTGNGQEQKTDKEAHSISSSEMKGTDSAKCDAENAQAIATVTDSDVTMSHLNGDLLNEDSRTVHVENPPLSLPEKEIEVVGEEHPIDSSPSTKSGDADILKIDEDKSNSIMTESPNNAEAQVRDTNVTIDSHINQKKQQEHKVDSPAPKIQDQLEEAQRLLKTTGSIGQSKEARLARVCAGLSSRLQEYKSENAQLEELLIAERELTKSYEAHIKQLQQDLSASKNEITKVESNMVEALAAKNSEIESLVSSMEALKKQAALSEGNLASLQANMESIMRNRELTETRMMQALREELASAERRAEEERAAHNATKMGAMEREVELEHRAVEASTALARIQRIADERTSKVAELEQKVALLEVECASLNQELQDMEARARRGQKKSTEEANQIIQIQAWQEEVERARQGQRDAESKLSLLEAEMQKIRVEMAAMKRDAEHYSRQEHMELEKRYRELTDLLYYKQTQLEAMASEKAAAEFQLEKEVKRLQEAQVEVERSRVSRRASSSWEEDTEIKALEPLPLHHRHMVGASIQLQKAAKLLDSGAVRATRFLWQYPTARVILLFYLVFVHLFLMYLLHRLQEQADNFAAREVAESMGLSNPKLP